MSVNIIGVEEVVDEPVKIYYMTSPFHVHACGMFYSAIISGCCINSLRGGGGGLLREVKGQSHPAASLEQTNRGAGWREGRVKPVHHLSKQNTEIKSCQLLLRGAQFEQSINNCLILLGEILQPGCSVDSWTM